MAATRRSCRQCGSFFFLQRENVRGTGILAVGIVSVGSHDGHPVVNGDGYSEPFVLSRSPLRDQLGHLDPLCFSSVCIIHRTLEYVRRSRSNVCRRIRIAAVPLRADEYVLSEQCDGPAKVVAESTIVRHQPRFRQERSRLGRVAIHHCRSMRRVIALDAHHQCSIVNCDACTEESTFVTTPLHPVVPYHIPTAFQHRRVQYAISSGPDERWLVARHATRTSAGSHRWTVRGP
mmetsp:Transcript_23857/g.57527  ORF Transcript_23857/g.57527 Transcript_23857/m.57527 type:complete len:233 (+) Transcript_23857:821-1519(+)